MEPLATILPFSVNDPSLTEKAKIVDTASLCSAPESAGSNLQYKPFIFSVAYS